MTRNQHARGWIILDRIACAICVIAALFFAVSCTATGTPTGDSALERSVERGRYLATVAGCGDCHTPMVPGPHGPEHDTERLLSGHPETLPMPAPPAGTAEWMWSGAATGTAFAGPWGTSYAVNLTPDVDTGIGIWTEEIFVQTMRTGRHWGVSRPILPPMPWQNYGQMTDADLGAVFQYLRSIRPVRNRVPDAVIAEEPPAAGTGEKTVAD